MTRLLALALILIPAPTQPETVCTMYVCAKHVTTVKIEVKR